MASGALLRIHKKIKDLKDNLDYSARQIEELSQSEQKQNTQESNGVSLQQILAPDLLRAAIKKAEDINENLNDYDAM